MLSPYFNGYIRADSCTKRAAGAFTVLDVAGILITFGVKPVGHLDDLLRAEVYAEFAAFAEFFVNRD